MLRIAFFVLLSWMNSAHGQSSPCGVPSPLFDVSGAIIGGQATTPYVWPWQVAIETDDGSVWTLHCGGVIIGDNYVLTAAHCVTPRPGARSLLAIAGLYNRTELLHTQIKLIESARITFHPEFDEMTLENDLAIVHFPDAFDLSGVYAKSICLPPSSTTSYVENPNCYMAGWGQTAPTGPLSESLQRIHVDVIDPLHCELRYSRPTLPSETCVFDEVSRTNTACHGDMGGPLGCVVDAKFYVAGIASIVNEDCDPKQAQIYSNIPYFVDWIRSVTGDLSFKGTYSDDDDYYL